MKQQQSDRIQTEQLLDCSRIDKSPLMTAVIALPIAIPRAPNPMRIGAPASPPTEELLCS